MRPESSYFDLEYAYMQLTEGMNSLKVGENNDVANTIDGAFNSAFNIESHSNPTAMVVDGNDENHRNISSFTQLNAKLPYHYIIRISPVALDVSNIQPSFVTDNDFQIVAWKSVEGHLNTVLSYGLIMQLVDPGNDAAYIIQYLKHCIMEMHGNGLFLYIRAPDNDVQLEEIGEYAIDMCALFQEFWQLFRAMDVAFTSFE